MKPSQPQSQFQNQHSINRLAQSIFVVNRHAKAATNPKYLYWLKKTALERLIAEKKAIKEGLHFSRNPRFSQQQSDVLIRLGDYFSTSLLRKKIFEFYRILVILNPPIEIRKQPYL